MVAPITYNFTTGPSTVPDIGTLSYNGCVFSPLFTTEINGKQIKDEANRTVKYTEYTIKVDGYATMPDTSASTRFVMRDLRKLLSEQGGALIYQGRGCDIVVNNGSDLDVAWGPSPEVLDFQPLGGGGAAKIVWQVKVCINEQKRFTGVVGPGIGSVLLGGLKGPGKLTNMAGIAQPMLQFNYESVVSYGEDGFSKLDVRGVLEIPLTRIPNQKTRTLQQTADDLRNQLDTRIMKGIDLNKFRLTNRVFTLSRDKRTLEWQLSAEEMPYQQMPPDCTMVHGSYTVRPARTGYGICRWICSLRVTYIVRSDKPRRTAWLAFHSLVRERMAFSEFSYLKGIPDDAFGAGEQPIKGRKTALIMDFGFDEGLYLDSKTVTFSISWTLMTQMRHILLASGIWRKEDERAPGSKQNLWATSMKNVQGSESWLRNRADANDDIIVDFGM